MGGGRALLCIELILGVESCLLSSLGFIWPDEVGDIQLSGARIQFDWNLRV